MAWETGVATCHKPEQVYAGDVSLVPGVAAGSFEVVGPDDWTDWIDVLVDDAEVRSPSWFALASAIKDRLLADPTIVGKEELVIADLWGMSDLSLSPTDDGVLDDNEELMLREYCGVLMASPDFLLRGVRLAPPLPEVLAEPVCLPDELCGVDALVDQYAKWMPEPKK